MSWFLTILFLTLTFGTNLSEANHDNKKLLPSPVVVGTVYCDTCFQQAFSINSHFISGASIAVECKLGKTKPKFYEEVKTNEHGEFKVKLPFLVKKHVKRIKVPHEIKDFFFFPPIPFFPPPIIPNPFQPPLIPNPFTPPPLIPNPLNPPPLIPNPFQPPSPPLIPNPFKPPSPPPLIPNPFQPPSPPPLIPNPFQPPPSSPPPLIPNPFQPPPSSPPPFFPFPPVVIPGLTPSPPPPPPPKSIFPFPLPPLFPPPHSPGSPPTSLSP
ncbi:pollen Ole e I family allergen [Trifolium pratense]|uniref:Pollen Ole e I family allergen n=1 Tax=Trifolium pratense TaxID=57577 RepID=A0A2K3ND88_TRIPR|nr:hypothetical protein L195_g018197 [Trifolium pratense]PNY01007.1 pollen Ole e I family allergen [Trifolium pratense]